MMEFTVKLADSELASQSGSALTSEFTRAMVESAVVVLEEDAGTTKDTQKPDG